MTKAIFLRNVAISFACLVATVMTACSGGGTPKTSDGKIDVEKVVKEELKNAKIEIRTGKMH